MTGSTIIPCLRYRDAKRMIGWLGGTFGFQPHAVHDDGKGGIVHAQLTLGSGMIMLGSTRDGPDEFGQVQSTPAQLGGTTQSSYVVVADADAIYRHAKAAGAEIVIEIKDEDYGGEAFPAAIRKDICGISALTIPGKREAGSTVLHYKLRLTAWSLRPSGAKAPALGKSMSK